MPCSRRPAGTVKVVGPPYGDELQPAGTGGNGTPRGGPAPAAPGRRSGGCSGPWNCGAVCVTRWGGPAGRCSAGGVRRCPAPVPRPVTAREKPAARTSRHLRPHGPGASSPAWRTKPLRSRAVVSSAGVRSVRSGSVEAGGSGMTEPVRQRGGGFGPGGSGAAGADRGRPRRPGRSTRDHIRCRRERLTVCLILLFPGTGWVRRRAGSARRIPQREVEARSEPSAPQAGATGPRRPHRNGMNCPAPLGSCRIAHPAAGCAAADHLRGDVRRAHLPLTAVHRAPLPSQLPQYGPPGVSRTPRRTRRPRGRPGGCGRSRRSGGRGPRRCAGRWRRG
ncbi:hypothetical protein SAMN06272775_6840 [Streptomyces sp. 2323.1]|nr:hypothetical protein SAMN06272775_6840 [Streptomyces sp. 2323.1]